MMPRFTIQMAKSNFLDRAGVAAKLDKATRGALSRSGGTIRKIARNSMKPAQKFRRRRRGASRDEPREVESITHSKPGEPPRVVHGHLKKSIFYYYDKDSRSVVIGPLLIPRSTGAQEKLEGGGTNVVGKRRRRTVRVAPRPYMLPALEAARPSIPKEFHNSLGRVG